MVVDYTELIFVVLFINHVSTVYPSGSTILSTPSSEMANLVPAVNCEFKVLDNKIRDELRKVDAKLIKFNISFKGYPDDILTLKGGTLVRPHIWFRSTSKHGETLLMLDDNFEVLSLSLLGLGVTRMDVELYDTPYGCMNNLGSEERVNKTRQLLLNDFKIPGPGEKSGSLDEDERICTMYIEETSDNYAEYKYVCCHIDPDGDEICEDVERNMWVKVLLVSFFIVTTLVGLFSPWFLPGSMYREKYMTTDYIYKFPNGLRKLGIKIIKTKKPEIYKDRKRLVPLESVKDLGPFKAMKLDTKYNLKMDQISLSVKSRKLLTDNYVPVSILTQIYEKVFRCQMKKYKSFCSHVLCRNITVYNCLRVIANLFMAALVVLPWIIRLLIYIFYEAPDVEEKKAVADKLNLHIHHSLYTVYRNQVTLYLTPVHALFIIMYILIGIDSCAFGILSKGVNNHKFNLILKKCLQDTRETSLTATFERAIKLCKSPVKKYKHGIRGYSLSLILWFALFLLAIPILLFSIFPCVNLTTRLLIYLILLLSRGCLMNSCCSKQTVMSDEVNVLTKKSDVAHDHEMTSVDSKIHTFFNEEFQILKNISFRHNVLHIIITVVCITSVISITCLLMECLAFFVEVGVYTLMGIIINSKEVLRYLTLLILICFYAYNSFSGIHKKYLDYHKQIFKELLKCKETEIRQAVLESEDTQKNVVFQVKPQYRNHVTSNCNTDIKHRKDTSVHSIDIKCDEDKSVCDIDVTGCKYSSVSDTDVTDGKDDSLLGKDGEDDSLLGIDVKNGKVCWKTKGLLVFLDKTDQPFTPVKFFYKTINMNYSTCPGNIYVTYLHAFKNFAKLLFFLLFVVIVVLAFGNKFSSTTEVLVTLAGGFVPFILKHFFKSGAINSGIDSEHPHFKAELDKKIVDFKQKWPIVSGMTGKIDVVEWNMETETTRNEVDLIIDATKEVDEDD